MKRRSIKTRRSIPKAPTPPAAGAPLSRWRKYAAEKRAWAALVRSLKSISTSMRAGVKRVASVIRKKRRKATRKTKRRYR